MHLTKHLSISIQETWNFPSRIQFQHQKEEEIPAGITSSCKGTTACSCLPYLTADTDGSKNQVLTECSGLKSLKPYCKRWPRQVHGWAASCQLAVHAVRPVHSTILNSGTGILPNQHLYRGPLQVLTPGTASTKKLKHFEPSSLQSNHGSCRKPQSPWNHKSFFSHSKFVWINCKISCRV